MEMRGKIGKMVERGKFLTSICVFECVVRKMKIKTEESLSIFSARRLFSQTQAKQIEKMIFLKISVFLTPIFQKIDNTLVLLLLRISDLF